MYRVSNADFPEYLIFEEIPEAVVVGKGLVKVGQCTYPQTDPNDSWFGTYEAAIDFMTTIMEAKCKHLEREASLFRSRFENIRAMPESYLRKSNAETIPSYKKEYKETA